MSREELLNETLYLIDKYNVTAYEIEKNTSLTAVGVQKIINRESKRPLENTLKDIISYINKAYKLNEKPTIINSNVANNVKEHVSQVNGYNEKAELERKIKELEEKASILELENKYLKAQISVFEKTMEMFQELINK